MAKELQVVDVLTILIDAQADGVSKSDTLREVEAFSRSVSTVLASAGETSFKPAEISTIDFLYVRPTGSNVLLRTKSAGDQYDIPDGGFFIIMKNSADVLDVRIAGGAAAAEVEVIVGEEP